jgi:hypothetical protein
MNCHSMTITNCAHDARSADLVWRVAALFTQKYAPSAEILKSQPTIDRIAEIGGLQNPDPISQPARSQ